VESETVSHILSKSASGYNSSNTFQIKSYLVIYAVVGWSWPAAHPAALVPPLPWLGRG